MKVVTVQFRIVCADFNNFGDESSPRSAFDLDDDVKRICDVRLDGAIRHFDTALQHTNREARNALGRRSWRARLKVFR